MKDTLHHSWDSSLRHQLHEKTKMSRKEMLNMKRKSPQTKLLHKKGMKNRLEIQESEQEDSHEKKKEMKRNFFPP